MTCGAAGPPSAALCSSREHCSHRGREGSHHHRGDEPGHAGCAHDPGEAGIHHHGDDERGHEGCNRAGECSRRFPVGTSRVTYTATDASGNVGTCTTLITVTPAPAAQVGGATFKLGAATGKFVEVDMKKCIDSVRDECNPGLTAAQVAAGARIVAWSSNQPQSVQGKSDVNAELGKNKFSVRADANPRLGERLYTISYAYTNASGAQAVGECKVGVSADKRGQGSLESGAARGWCFGPEPYCKR